MSNKKRLNPAKEELIEYFDENVHDDSHLESIKKPKMSKEKWPEVQKRKFIHSYINQPALWNIEDPDYSSKTKKTEAYLALQKEFDLTMNEVKNKIRIYRTTYAQELKKIEINNGRPKLSWFDDLYQAFNKGKIKSFIKSPKPKLEHKESDKLIEIVYQDEEELEVEKGDMDYEIKSVEKVLDMEDRQIIIEEDFEAEEYCEEATSSPPKTYKSADNSQKSSHCTGLQSNELFLRSLLSTLDKLPDDKNMRARIKIQEALYNIAYEK